ncbi:hypothetical protein ACEV7C_17895 [Enterobacter ludwigii]|uniref:hypothetical protein n=1 Tax=Enterobacter ludwigii TaxID=299767 RepID=UPI003BEEE67A
MQHGNEHSEGKDYPALSASQVIEWIHTNQDKFPAAQSHEEAKQLLEAAAQLISYDMEYRCDEDGEEVDKNSMIASTISMAFTNWAMYRLHTRFYHDRLPEDEITRETRPYRSGVGSMVSEGA